MKRTFLPTVILVFAGMLMGTTTVAQKVYKETDPTQANVKIFVTADMSTADLKVFEVGTAEDSRRDGQWFLVSTPEEAYIKVYITENEAEAQLKVYNVDNAELAGWITNNKRHFYKVGK